MKAINTFWKQERPTPDYATGNSMTVQGAGITIEDVIKSGSIEELSAKIRKRMIFGERIKFEDLSKFDYFKKKFDRYNNLMQAHDKATKTKINAKVAEVEELQNEV